MNYPFDTVPEGWELAPLTSLSAQHKGAMTDGPFGSNLKSAHYTGSGPRVIRLQNIGDGVFIEADAHISPEHYSTLIKHAVESGDVLIAILGEVLPRACLAPPSIAPAIVKADCIRFRPDPNRALPKYVCFALNAEQTRRRAAAVVHGVGRPRLSLGELRELQIPLAPLSVQQSIVETVDTHFSRIDAGVAALKRVQANLKRYRASVLKAACEGRLVPTEAELARRESRDYEPASLLLERILKERRRHWEASELAKLKAKGKPPSDDRWKSRYKEAEAQDTSKLPELPEGWCWATTDMVGDVLLGRQRAPQYLTGKWTHPYLRVANVKDDRVDLSDIETMDFDPVHFVQYALLPGDILVSEGQSPELVGQSAIYRGGIEGLCFQKTLHRFRRMPHGPTPEFAQIVFRAHVKTGFFRKVASITTNIAHLTLEKFKASPFPLPPLAEQVRITAEVKRRTSLADHLQEALSTNRARGDRLRQSILASAFQGTLTGTRDGSGVIERHLANASARQLRSSLPDEAFADA